MEHGLLGLRAGRAGVPVEVKDRHRAEEERGVAEAERPENGECREVEGGGARPRAPRPLWALPGSWGLQAHGGESCFCLITR